MLKAHSPLYLKNKTGKRYADAAVDAVQQALAQKPEKKQRTEVIYYAVHVVCGKRHKKDECPSVCPVDRQQQQRLAGLPLRSGAGSRYRSTATAARTSVEFKSRPCRFQGKLGELFRLHIHTHACMCMYYKAA